MNQTYEHFFYSPTKQDAGDLAADLQRYGALVPNPPRRAAGFKLLWWRRQWLVRAYTDYLTDELGEAQLEHLQTIAADNRSHYDGGGMWVGGPGL